jgi:hypothetical protein
MSGRVLALAVVAAIAAGCAAKLPPGHWDAAARRVCAGRVCYVVGALDDSWQMVHQESAAAGWFNTRAGAIIASNASCHDDAEAAPLSALTRQLLVGYTERRILDERVVPFAQREALRTRVIAKLDGVPMELEILVLRRNGCVFDLSYAAPPGSFAVAAPDFARFVAGFVDARPNLAAAVKRGS